MESRAIIPDPTQATNMVADLGWDKRHVAGPNHLKNQAIIRALGHDEAMGFGPLCEYY